jgi:hypothetical protein
MKRLILLVLFSLPLQVSAQKSMANIWVEGAIPVGDFRQNTDAFGIGMGLGAYFSFDANHMFFFGADLSYDIYGKSFESDGFYEIITNNNMLRFHGVLRIMPATDGVKPIIEGLYGFKYLYTISKLKDNILLDPIALKTEFHSIAPSYGGSVGLSIPVGGDVASLDFRVQYIIGGKADYIDGKTIRTLGIDEAIANPIRSETDMVVVKLGLTFGW